MIRPIGRILTSNMDPATERECMQAGATDYIIKPWGPEELEDRVTLAIEHSLV